MNCKTMPHSRPCPLALCAAVLISMGCGTASERSALAQIRADHDDASTAPRVADSDLPGVTVRRVWAGEYRDFYASSISPDGRYMSQVDWSTVDLAVRDLYTGDLHRLTNVQRGPDKPYEDAGVSVFSRDGSQLVVGWQVAPDLQLRVLDFVLDGNGVPAQPEARVLFDNPAFYPYYPFDWSPDGKQILAKVYANSTQLALISTDDGTYQSLKSFDWREPTMAEFSPDGKYVAYDFLPDQDSDDRDVFVVSVDGGYQARVVEGPALDRFLGWHPDGHILFHSDRSGTPGIWRIPMLEGRATGAPELVKPDLWRADPLGFAGDRFYYGVDARQSRLMVAPVDFATGRLTGPARVVADASPGFVYGWDWSPDGEMLVYSATVPGSRGSKLGIHRANGEELRTFRTELSQSRRIRWHPDGKSLIMFARDTRGRRGFHRIDLETGSHSAILVTDLMEESTPRGNFALSPDGTTLYYARGRMSDDRMNLVAVDLASGRSRHVSTVRGGVGSVALSPDGSRLAVDAPGTTDAIGIVAVTGGEVARLEPIPEGSILRRMEWTPDGRWIVYTARRGLDVVVRVVAEDGSEARWLEFPEGVGSVALVRVHSNSGSIAFEQHVGDVSGEVWVMEGLGESVTETAAPGSHDDDA